MISFWISVVPPKIDWTMAEPPELTTMAESSGLILALATAGFIWSAQAAAFA